MTLRKLPAVLLQGVARCNLAPCNYQARAFSLDPSLRCIVKFAANVKTSVTEHAADQNWRESRPAAA